MRRAQRPLRSRRLASNMPSDTLAMTVSVSTPVPETRVGSGKGCTRAWEGDGVCVGGPRDEARKVKRGDRGGEEHARKARSRTTMSEDLCAISPGGASMGTSAPTAPRVTTSRVNYTGMGREGNRSGRGCTSDGDGKQQWGARGAPTRPRTTVMVEMLHSEAWMPLFHRAPWDTTPSHVCGTASATLVTMREPSMTNPPAVSWKVSRRRKGARSPGTFSTPMARSRNGSSIWWPGAPRRRSRSQGHWVESAQKLQRGQGYRHP
jgi:hypothetical protein